MYQYPEPGPMPLGLVSFRLKLGNPGDTAGVLIYFSKTAWSDARRYQYESIRGKWNDYSGSADFSEDGKSVTLKIRDGDFNDADGVENGVIVDTSGLVGTTPTPVALSAPAPTGEAGGAGCFISTASE